MKLLKSIKTITLASILGLILLVASVNTTNAGPRIVVALNTPPVEVISACPGPGFVWVRGHYRVGMWGHLVWVPGHWRRI